MSTAIADTRNTRLTAASAAVPSELAIVPQAEMAEIRKLDAYARAASRQLIEAEMAKDDMAKGLIMARALKTLHSLLSVKIMTDVMELMGTPLGFRTDRDSEKEKYSPEQIRYCLIQALLRGLRPTGNEINIIAGNLYVTVEGFARLLREFQGLTQLAIQIGVPATGDKGALVPARASWYLHGERDELICEKIGDADYRIAVRVNSGMGVDAIQGKARSKLYRRIYERITGTQVGIDIDEPIVPAIEGSTKIASE